MPALSHPHPCTLGLSQVQSWSSLRLFGDFAGAEVMNLGLAPGKGPVQWIRYQRMKSSMAPKYTSEVLLGMPNSSQPSERTLLWASLPPPQASSSTEGTHRPVHGPQPSPRLPVVP